MNKLILLYKMAGITFVVGFILTSCNLASSPVAPVTVAATQAVGPSPMAATATLPPVATATASPVPTATETLAPTATAVPTATIQQIAQVIPSINAFCRKGPGSGYYKITFLQQGTAYNVIGQNGLKTWWLIQAPGNVTCWVGDPGASLQGPTDQAPTALVQPLPMTPATFVESDTCNTSAHTLHVLFNWSAVANVTGYRIYRNGTQITDAGPNSTAYTDSSAPTGTNLVYELEAHNDYGAAPVITVSVPTCG
jgi:hypothetical protein